MYDGSIMTTRLLPSRLALSFMYLEGGKQGLYPYVALLYVMVRASFTVEAAYQHAT